MNLYESNRSVKVRSSRLVEPFDHDIRGLNEGRGAVTLLEPEFPHGICRDDCGDVRVRGGEHNLGEKAVDSDTHDLPGQLIPSADAAVSITRLGRPLGSVPGEEGPKSRLRNPVVPAGRLDCIELSAQYPLLDRGVTDTEKTSCFTRREEIDGRHGIHI